MTRRSWRIKASGIFLTVAGGWLLARRPAAPPGGMDRATAPVARVSLKAAPAATGTITLPAFGSPEFAQTVRERSAAWLAARGRDAGSLVALWDVTGDEALLREAAEKYPDQPVVCAALVQHLLWEEAPAAELKQWIGQFIQSTPGNPLGYHYLATLCAREGDDAGAVAALEKALEQTGRPDSYLRDRIMTAREGALAGGASPGDAASLSLAGPLQRCGPVVLGANMTGFFKERFSSLKAAGDVEQSQAFAELGLKVVTQLSYAKSPGLIDELVADSLRKKFLTEMDPDTMIGDTGRKAAELLQEELPSLRELAGRANEIMALETAPDSVRAAYTDRFVLDGEASALRWFLAWKDARQEGP